MTFHLTCRRLQVHKKGEGFFAVLVLPDGSSMDGLLLDQGTVAKAKVSVA